MNKDSDSKFHAFSIVIEELDKNLNKHIGLHNILSALYIMEEQLNNKMSFYLIMHDRDINDKNELERIHYHLVIEIPLKNKKREYTIFRMLVKALECSEEVISLDHSKSLVSSVQYLIHKNDKNKYQYDLAEVVTNDPVRLTYLMQDIGYFELTTIEIIEVVNQENTYQEIISRIGLVNFQRYNATIRLLVEENKILKTIQR